MADVVHSLEGHYKVQREHTGGRFPIADEDDPLPPFQVRDVDMFYAMGALEEEAAAALLPAGMEQAPSRLCMVAIYVAPDGWGLAPFSAAYVRLAVAGYDSPDGTEGMMLVAGAASGRAGSVIRRHYHDLWGTGASNYSVVGRTVEADGLLANDCRIAVSARFTDHPVYAIAGAHRMLGLDKDGGLISFSTGFSTSCIDVEVERFDWSIPDGHRLEALRGFQPTTAFRLFDKSFTFSEPHRVEALRDTGDVTLTRTSLIQLLEQLRLAVLVLETGTGQVFVSARARDLLGEELPLAAIRRSTNYRSLAGQVHTAAPLSILESPVRLRRESGGELIARLLPLSPSLWGSPALMAVLTDIGSTPSDNVDALLRALGLTAAEARVARIVGRGATAAQAAHELGITANTARWTLKVVHDKLGIGRRAELAAIVRGLSSF